MRLIDAECLCGLVISIHAPRVGSDSPEAGGKDE